MRLQPIPFLAALALLAGSPLPVLAQQAAPLTDPAPDAPDSAPAPGDRSPMIVPAPDDDPEPAPDAFGSPVSEDDNPAEAIADQADAAMRHDETREAMIDRLFGELKRTADETKAAHIAARIEREWRHSGSATVDLLMARAAEAMIDKNTAAAYDMLDQAIVLDPAYAEAWNRRATLSFTTDDWGKSIADIEQTLAREPRHWGALMGLATILERMDRKPEALQTYMKVLAIYPALRSAQDAAGRLSEELLGPAI
ncbi:hypothetical protein [Jiella sp. M17.18]|uniref:hypothetical protein n=1 Tax=Jiella sp. M17.18 TaxID=3234247 RepID=UPI0034DE2E22